MVLEETSGCSLPQLTSWLRPGTVSFAIAGVGLTFYLLVQELIDDYNRESRMHWARIDNRWRFYSVFVSLMYALFFQCLAFAVPALIYIDTSWKMMTLFANGFLPLPLAWLELVYSRNFRLLGLTKYYEGNCQNWFPELIKRFHTSEEIGRHKENIGLIERISSFLVTLWTWIVIYFFCSLLGLHIRENRKHRDLAEPRLRWKQLAQDFLVFLSAWLYLGCLVVALVGLWNPQAMARFGALYTSGIVWTFFGVTVAAALLGLLAYARREDPKSGDLLPAIILAGYTLCLGFDLACSGWLWGMPYPLSGLAVIASPTGALSPWLLLLLLIYLSSIFLDQLRRAREISYQSAVIAEHALHRFGNLLAPPSIALRLIGREIHDTEGLARLSSEKPRHEEVLHQIDNALEALGTAQGILLDLKAHSRRVPQEHWYHLTTLLKPFAREEQYPKDGGVLKVTVEPGPQGVEIYTDKEDFEDTIHNLVENSRQAFTSNRREIRITVHYVPHQISPMKISVWDDGPGIDDKLKRRIFDATFSTKPSGLGLGLFLVQQFVNRMGGLVEVASKTGARSYTDVQLSFPLERVRSLSRTSQLRNPGIRRGGSEESEECPRQSEF